MLDLLASRKALEEQEASEGGGKKLSRKRKNAANLQDLLATDFVLLSVEMSRASQINMKAEPASGDRVRDRKVALNFITVTPRQLIEKEGQEKKGARVNLFAKGTRDLISHKEDFRVNSQFVMSACTVGEDLNANCEDLQQSSVSLCDEDEETFSETHLFSQQQQQQPIAGEQEVSLANLLPPPSSPSRPPNEDEDDGDDFFGGADLPAPDSPAAASGSASAADSAPEDHVFLEPEAPPEKRKRRDRFQESLDEPKAPITNTWEPVKPHEAENLVAPKKPKKPVKKSAKTTKAPNDSVELKRTKRKPRPLPQTGNKVQVRTVLVGEFLIEDLDRSLGARRAGNNNAAREGADKEVSSKVSGEDQARKDRKANANNNREEEEQGKGGEAADQDNDGWEDINAGGPDDDFDADDPGADSQPLPNPHLGDSGAGLPPPTGHNDSTATGDTTFTPDESDSYEDMVKRRVTDFLQQSKEYIDSTELAKKVSHWHELIRPRLERVEKRAHFDIHKYGSKILDKFPEEQERKTETESGDAAGQKVLFHQVAQGMDKEEVCRYFLSSLMLANTMNVDIKMVDSENREQQLVEMPEPEPEEAEGDAEEEADPEASSKKKRKRRKPPRRPAGGKKGAATAVRVEDLPMDRLQLTLLSKRRHHDDIMRFNAENALMMGNVSEDEATSSPAKSPTKRKRSPQKAKKGQKKTLEVSEEDFLASELSSDPASRKRRKGGASNRGRKQKQRRANRPGGLDTIVEEDEDVEEDDDDGTSGEDDFMSLSSGSDSEEVEPRIPRPMTNGVGEEAMEEGSENEDWPPPVAAVQTPPPAYKGKGKGKGKGASRRRSSLDRQDQNFVHE